MSLPTCPALRTAGLILLVSLFCGLWLGPCRAQAIENSNASHLALPRFFTLAQSDSHIVLSANGSIAHRLVASKREITFDFRTRYPNVIILYETFYVTLSENRLFALLLALLNGRFQMVLEYQGQEEEILIGHSFNRDLLHRVHLYINPELGFLNIRVNASESTKYYKSLYFNSTFLPNDQALTTYKLSLGGIPFLNQTAYYQLNGYRNLVGCIGNLNIISRSNESNFGTLSLSHLSMHNVLDGCIDRCDQLNLCSRRARCVNYYDSKECDCFGSELEDWHCRSFNYTVLTLRGYSTISYHIYPFLSRTYSSEHLISLHIKTQQDGILFAALSETFQSYLILNIKNGFLNVFFNLGSNPKNYIYNDFQLSDDLWHNVTLVQHHSKIFVYLDTDTRHVITLDETDPYFFFDPEIYVGGFPSNLNISSLNLPLSLPNKKFVGCLKHVYFNSINILYSLHRKHKEAKYHSLFGLELGCHAVESVPITIQPNSYFKVPIANKTSTFGLEFKLRSDRYHSKVANGTFLTDNGEKRKWHLLLRKSDVKLSIEYEQANMKRIGWTLSNDNSLNVSAWNKVTIVADSEGFFQMSVNELNVQGRYDSTVDSFTGSVNIGSVDSRLPFIGCIQDVVVNNQWLEPRTLAEDGSIVGRVSLDNCQLTNACNRPNACEHGAMCIPVPENGTYFCDCSNTGYIGKTCHFSAYRKSCEEIYLKDKRHSGIYMIDIDRNGPLPPAHVICDLIHNEDGSVSFRTVIEHNIQHQVIVREKGQTGSFYMDVVYRDFNLDMLRLLVKRSARCQQYIKYECNDAPLSLSSYTLLFSTLPDYKVARIEGSNAKGCKCGGTPNKCVDTSKKCNCDAQLYGWKHDEGTLSSPEDVGITKMFFLQFPNITRDSEAHLFLGNLSCIDTDTQKYQITFKTKQSYLQVPGWVGQEMGISFRTTASSAVIFFQSHLDSKSSYFKAVIISENEVRFEYSLHGKKNSVTVRSSHCLNCGQWQHVWIERYRNQIRVSINQNSQIMYLDKNDFIEFDGKLFVGGAPLEYLKGLKINLGFIGCLQGLVFDNQVVNLHKFLDPYRKPNIESGCRPYCKPNLCLNQGHCVELWGSYECKCANPVAHSGKNCEININRNSITFKKAAPIGKVISSSRQMKAILQEDIILSFRTHGKSSLLLYAHDTLNNFVQLHTENGTNVVFTFNWLRRIVRRDIMLGTPLVSGQIVQVKVDRSYKNSSSFIVNQKSVFIPYPVAFIKESSIDREWRAGLEYELVKRNRSRAVVWSRNEFFIGGLRTGEAISSMADFVGCIQGLVLGGQLIDLSLLANQTNDTEVMSFVKPGCKMLCDKMPCKNGGICTEDWENESTKCDCDSTSYRGDLCDIDIGAFFQKNSSVLYFLDSNLVLDFTNVDISFAFSSSHIENNTLLLLRYANSTRYLHIALLADGRLMVEEDNGHDIYLSIIESEEDTFFQDSHRHWLHYVRKERAAQIIADSLIYHVSGTNYMETLKNIPQIGENIIQIGSNRFNNQDLAPFSNFKGCISNINIVLDDFKIDPFESAFGFRSGLSNVKVNGDVKQGICASFHTHRASIALQVDQTAPLTNLKEIWLHRPKPSLVPLKRTDQSNKHKSYIRKDILMPLCIGYLLLVLLFVSVYMWRVDRHYRLLKFQGETPFFHKKPNMKRTKRLASQSYF